MSYRRFNGYDTVETNKSQEVFNETHDQVKFKLWGFQEDATRNILYHLISILFLGIPYLMFKAYPKLKKVKFKSASIENATFVLVTDNHGESRFIRINEKNLTLPKLGALVENTRYFFYQYTLYIWDKNLSIFVALDELIPAQSVNDYLNNHEGLTDEEYAKRLDLYGFNKIEVEVKSYFTLFIEEVLNPFYVFQCFSVLLWLFDDYVSYAICVVILTLFSSVTSLIQTRRQSEALHDLVESSKSHEVTVLRKGVEGNTKAVIDPVNLVPGDLIILPASNFVMPCDVVLLTGECIVNESVLTGESVPITKTALHSGSEMYNIEIHKRHTLFSGTNVIQTRYYGGANVLARVARTGFDTTKGSLVKSILFPAPIGLKFYKDSFKFILVLFTVAAAGMCYSFYLYISRGAPLSHIIIRTLDIITIVVPPALPAAMAVGTVYSQNRLKKIGIFCISPARINVCGKIKIACFDKTGTLTHDGLEMNCVIPSYNCQFSEPVTEISALKNDEKLVQAMTTCHSLTTIENELNGDPLDLNMFQFTEWELHEPGEDEHARYDMLAPPYVKPAVKSGLIQVNGFDKDSELPYEIGILRQFTFSSTLQCMSVICRVLNEQNMMVFTKGAPEKILSMCLKESIPVDFLSRLSEFTAQGFRVIAVAYKYLPDKMRWVEAQKINRNVIECDLTFLGFLIMHNPLKKETAPVIRLLHNANIRTVMITGDNILTAVSVAHDCGIAKKSDHIFILTLENDDCYPDKKPNIKLESVGSLHGYEADNLNRNILDVILHRGNSFAIDGKTWTKLKFYYPDLIPTLLVKVAIFARFQPDQKTQLIVFFQKLDYIVSMVGDGANDCGALKAAHVGISLSQAEASVAAPFTSAIPNISCLVHLMLEGRCALVTSFAIFKYMALYSLIQFFTVLILYRQHSLMGDYQFLFIDLIITTSLAVTIGRQGPAPELCAKRPMSSLVSIKNLIPLILQIFTCAMIQIATIYYLFQQPWFKPIPDNTKEPVIVSWENTAVFTVSCYQYIIMAVVYSKGRPYREMLITNFWFLITSLSLTICITWLIVYPCKAVADLMQLVYVQPGKSVENEFKYSLLIFPIVHFLIATFIEVGIADRVWLKKFVQFIQCKSMPKNRYKLLLQHDAFLSLIDMNV